MAPPANRRGNRGGGGNQGGQQGAPPEDSAREIFDAAIVGALSKVLGRQIGTMLPRLAMDQLYALVGQKQLGMATRFLGEAIALNVGDDIPRRAVIDGMSGLADALESIDFTQQNKANLKAQVEGIVRGNAKFQELAGHTPEFFEKSHLVPFSEALTGLSTKERDAIVALVSFYDTNFLMGVPFSVRELSGIAMLALGLAAGSNPPGRITQGIANRLAKRFAPKPVVPDEYIALLDRIRKQFEDHEKRPDTVPLPQRLRAGTHASAVARQGVENGVQRVAAAHPKTELRRFFDNLKKLLKELLP